MGIVCVCVCGGGRGGIAVLEVVVCWWLGRQHMRGD